MVACRTSARGDCGDLDPPVVGSRQRGCGTGWERPLLLTLGREAYGFCRRRVCFLNASLLSERFDLCVVQVSPAHAGQERQSPLLANRFRRRILIQDQLEPAPSELREGDFLRLGNAPGAQVDLIGQQDLSARQERRLRQEFGLLCRSAPSASWSSRAL